MATNLTQCLQATFPTTPGEPTKPDTEPLLPQLTEEHGDELAPASETSSMTLRVVLAHGRCKFQTRD